jgi:predicted O-methyltransferase YrrM
MKNSGETVADEIQDIIQLINRIPIGGEITEREGECLLYDLAKERHTEGVIVEIGSWKGLSTTWLAKAALASDRARVYAIDPHLEPTYPSFRQNMKAAGVENIIIPLVMKAEEAIKGWSEPISLLWVDGSHEYEDENSSFVFYEPYLEVGGVIAFHDYFGYSGTRRVIRRRILRSNQFSKIGCVERIIFATKVKQCPFKERQFMLRLLMLVMSYACDLVHFLGLHPHGLFDFAAKPESQKPMQRFFYRFEKKILTALHKLARV